MDGWKCCQQNYATESDAASNIATKITAIIILPIKMTVLFPHHKQSTDAISIHPLSKVHFM
jgi:hypothetical protein